MQDSPANPSGRASALWAWDWMPLVTLVAVANGSALITGFLSCAQLPMLWTPLATCLTNFIFGLFVAIMAFVGALFFRIVGIFSGPPSMSEALAHWMRIAIMAVLVARTAVIAIFVAFSAYQLEIGIVKSTNAMINFKPIYALASINACDAERLAHGRPTKTVLLNKLADEGYTSLADRNAYIVEKLALDAKAKKQGIKLPPATTSTTRLRIEEGDLGCD